MMSGSKSDLLEVRKITLSGFGQMLILSQQYFTSTKSMFKVIQEKCPLPTPREKTEQVQYINGTWKAG